MDAIAATLVYLLYLSLYFVGTTPQTQAPSHIPLATSLNHSTPWLSPSALFAFGFYPYGNGYAVGIWLVGDNDLTVVWTANRDDPPVTSNAKLQLTNDGNLVLLTEQGQVIKPIANVNATASYASMLDSGNFVLYNNESGIIWQSFNHPTDTILGGQSLPNGAQLFSSSSETNRSSGRFYLWMQGDGDLVLYPVGTAGTRFDAYWGTGDYSLSNGHRYNLYLNETGSLVIRNSGDLVLIHTLNDGDSSMADNNNNNNKKNHTVYRATLDYDGVFRLYVHVNKNNVSTVKNWPDNNACRVKGFCGFNSYCTFDDDKPYCNCLPGFEFIDPNQNILGCKRNFSEAECRAENDNAAFYNMVSMKNIEWGDIPYFFAEMLNEDECFTSCSEDCNCWAAIYDHETGSCSKQEPPLRYVRRKIDTEGPSQKSTAFLKVGNNSLKNLKWKDKPVPEQPLPVIKSTSNKAIVQIILVTSCFTLLLCLTIATTSHLIYKIRVLSYKRLMEIGDFGLNEEVALRRFSYHELKRATNNFKEELGKGSFGAVYKGALSKGRRLIAVKRLEKLVEEGEREFQAEMRAIGKTHHRNLVRLLGFCADGSKRLLVYEYMSNGSLGKLLFGDARRPDWDERVRIALEIAKGILYLHEECEAPIIHCDIKPQNILMDEFWTAKISDFGLAKLLMPDQTRTFTGVRGTRGYMAPEWHKNTPISTKVDVYSYGIVLLELVCRRRKMEVNASEPEEIMLSYWAYKCFDARELNKLVVWETVDKNVLENMVKVALWCIQDEPVLRPTMKSVVLMLEGVTDIAIPPCPSSSSM